MARQVLAILDDKNFAEIFAPGSRAEVPIVGRIARAGRDPIPVAGQVDRLAVTGDTVLIADYKTDRIVPDRLDEVRNPTSPSSRSTARCWPASFRAKPCARRCCSPMGRSSWKCPAAVDGCGLTKLDQARNRPMTRGSRRGEAPLTPFGAVHRFNAKACQF